jgi:hypothetical protein
MTADNNMHASRKHCGHKMYIMKTTTLTWEK